MPKDIYARKFPFKGIEAVELGFGRYYAVVAPSLGSNVMRLRDNENNIEVFRYSEELTVAQFLTAPEIWGLPCLYLPNRFDGGVLRTSDDVYRLPVNEKKFENHLHGFMHKRVHKIKDMGTNKNSAYVITEFVYDENDIFFNCFPVKFRAELTVALSENGLTHSIKLTDLSEKKLPVSIATHTTYNAPFTDNSVQEDIRLFVPAAAKLQFNKKRWLPNGRTLNLNKYDSEYVNGGKCPVLRDICNDMYISGTLRRDGKELRAVVIRDTACGKCIINEIDENYKFWIVWNDKGFKNYFCAEPMTAQVNAPNLDLPGSKTGYCELSGGESFTASQKFYTSAD